MASGGLLFVVGRGEADPLFLYRSGGRGGGTIFTDVVGSAVGGGSSGDVIRTVMVIAVSEEELHSFDGATEQSSPVMLSSPRIDYN